MNDQVDDDEFGPLVWDDQCDCWTGQATLPDGTVINVLIECAAWAGGGRPSDRAILPGCRTAIRMLPDIVDNLKQTAVNDLLSVYNDIWNQTGIPISAAEFSERIWLEGVALSPDGSLEAYFDTEDLFTDHSIRIPVGSDGKPSHKAGLEG